MPRKLWLLFSSQSPEGKFIDCMDTEINNIHSTFAYTVGCSFTSHLFWFRSVPIENFVSFDDLDTSS